MRNGEDVVIYDFDGPRGSVTCIEVTLVSLIEKIEDGRFPFGHGYVVAAYLADIPIEEFIK